ncbi:MAG TPA: ROK family protein [Acidobacteriota bacterium]|nr:ROK family protein [Acidobacteriota bacterium]
MNIKNTLPDLLDEKPRTVPAFDPGFRPMGAAFMKYRKAVEDSGKGVPLRIGVERENGLVSVFATEVLPSDGGAAAATAYYAERIVKFLLWWRGGWKIRVQGPKEIGDLIRKAYAPDGARAFDASLMGRVYEKTFEVVSAGPADFPPSRESKSALGGNLDGCRVGFDLGASDFKVAAVKDGEPVFSEEIPWTPGEKPDPEYHYNNIRDGLKMAAAHLPRVDAIGGSSAGIYIDNQVRIASLFRSVPVDVFDRKVKNMFNVMKAEWGVPFEVINDGEVTALAGTMSLGAKAMLGVAMGSSQAGGFLNADGHIPGWLDELAFAPLDASPDAVADEWSGDQGVGANYFSQQAVNKLALRAGVAFPEDMRLPERLKHVQALAEKGDVKARRIFADIGIYLGYTVPFYEMFYEYRNLLILGRVMSGVGGDIIMETAGKVLREEFPETAGRVRLHLLDEKSRRVGQAVAAASLPRIQ